MTKLQNFTVAFEIGGSSIQETCACGKIFYDASSDYDFEEGEFEALEANKEAIGCWHSIGRIAFEGKEYVSTCECWKPRAKQLMEYLDTYNHEIAAYLNAERKRKIEEAEALPTVA